jgi:carbonic anhydrase
MKNALFIICPFSCMELPLKKKYGDESFFVTFPGAVIPAWNEESLEDLRELIRRENIRCINIVNDTSCRLINSILREDVLFGLPAEKRMAALYNAHRADLNGRPIEEQALRLAELNIRKQVDEIRRSPVIGTFLAENNIAVKGLLTTKERNIFREISIKNNSSIYEF